MPIRSFSRRTLIVLLAVYTGAVAAMALFIAFLLAGYGETGTSDALRLAVPVIALVCAGAVATYFAVRVALRRGHLRTALLCLSGYMALPLPVLGILVF